MKHIKLYEDFAAYKWRKDNNVFGWGDCEDECIKAKEWAMQDGTKEEDLKWSEGHVEDYLRHNNEDMCNPTNVELLFDMLTNGKTQNLKEEK